MHSLRRHTPHQSKTFAHKRRNRLVWIVILSLVSITALTFACTKFFSLPAFEITSVRVFGADTDISATLQSAAEDVMNGSYVGLFDRSNAFIYPKNSIVSTLITLSPRIATVSVHRDGWNSLIITVSQKTPSALVCASLPDWSEGTAATDSLNQCYFTDDTGFMFQQAPAFSGHIYNRYFIPFASDATTSDILAGTYATSTPEFRGLQNLYEGMKSLGLNPEGILVKDSGEYELYVDQIYKDQKGDTQTDIFVVYFNDKRSFVDELQNFGSFWTAKVSNVHVTHPHFEYIDVRYGSNVFYKEASN